MRGITEADLPLKQKGKRSSKKGSIESKGEDTMPQITEKRATKKKLLSPKECL
jgi:hypothetical protein